MGERCTKLFLVYSYHEMKAAILCGTLVLIYQQIVNFVICVQSETFLHSGPSVAEGKVLCGSGCQNPSPRTHVLDRNIKLLT